MGAPFSVFGCFRPGQARISLIHAPAILTGSLIPAHCENLPLQTESLWHNRLASYNTVMASIPSERTPLLGPEQPAHLERSPTLKDTPPDNDGAKSWSQRIGASLQALLSVHVEKRILLAGFLITLSFSFTQVP